jgi:hypothetical protein
VCGHPEQISPVGTMRNGDQRRESSEEHRVHVQESTARTAWAWVVRNWRQAGGARCSPPFRETNRRCQAKIVAGVTGKTSAQRLRRCQPTACQLRLQVRPH